MFVAVPGNEVAKKRHRQEPAPTIISPFEYRLRPYYAMESILFSTSFTSERG